MSMSDRGGNLTVKVNYMLLTAADLMKTQKKIIFCALYNKQQKSDYMLQSQYNKILFFQIKNNQSTKSIGPSMNAATKPVHAPAT